MESVLTSQTLAKRTRWWETLWRSQKCRKSSICHLSLRVCVCFFWRRLHLCSIYSRTLKVSCRHILTKGRGTRVCVLMRDWHHARGASLAEECGSRQIDCSFTRSIGPSTSLRHYTVSRHSCAVCIFYSLCLLQSKKEWLLSYISMNLIRIHLILRFFLFKKI